MRSFLVLLFSAVIVVSGFEVPVKADTTDHESTFSFGFLLTLTILMREEKRILPTCI